MTSVSIVKNRWGDPPLLVRGRVSLLAATAFAISLAVLASAAGTLGLAGALTGELRVPAAAIMLLLTLFLFSAAPVVLVLAYVGLSTCRIGTPLRGRSLAWAALGLAYVAVVCRLALAATEVWLANGALVALLVFGAVHVLMFAAESRFAKTAVSTVAIAGIFLSLLGPWILYSREQSRRLQCVTRLRQIGLHLQAQFDANRAWQSARLSEVKTEPPSAAPYMRSPFQSIEPSTKIYALPTGSQGNTLWRTPTWRVENEQRRDAPGVDAAKPSP